ncbi:uncharacterized protein LOC111604818 [Drosophila hydei]|uniref:Uncharacterized protein LOC111604818 n=1 Tax=Drosophila hydei TaxID=7224 RepID=A0A6J1MDK4_DROHY|nr:uncharacterized protein LOC111604818 [Drosophila hydei]
MSTVNAPEWVNQQLFSDLLKHNCSEFDEIQKFEVTAAISGGENYMTIVLRIGVEFRLKDDSCNNESYILKIPLVNDRGDQHNFHELFVVESDMYERLVPELGQLYAKHTNLSVRFKPAHLKFIENPPNCDYILMEDLRKQGYINLERMVGLGQTEIKAVLKKLAQWHAASAQRVVELGDYDEKYQKSYMSEPEWVKHMNLAFNGPFLEYMQQLYELEPSQQLLVTNYTERLNDLYLEFGRVKKSEFNVLNHGDFWCNNFLFKLNGGNIQDICFVDFQVPKYGTPAQDLFSLLMTTPNIQIKLKKFDDFIEFYFDELIAHLKLFKYANKLPTLTELHKNLRSYSLWAFVCAQRMLPVTLLPPTPDANTTKFEGDSAVDFKHKMFTNPSYIKQIKLILPWLIERGYIN